MSNCAPSQATSHHRPTLALILLVGLASLAFDSLAQEAEPFSHDDWSAVLGQYVDAQGLVDYAGLAKNRQTLDRYLAHLAAASPMSQPHRFPTRQEALAYYLNAYNAYTFAGVLEVGPEAESVWATAVQGYKFFIARKIVLGGEKTNLKKLEDEDIRETFADPRIHAALVCAAVSCPRLPQKAFEGTTVDQQLDAAIREFVNNERHVRHETDEGIVYLSKIFDWYDDDFLAYERAQGREEPTLLDYVNRYRDPADALPRDAKVRFVEYDKSLNKQ